MTTNKDIAVEAEQRAEGPYTVEKGPQGDYFIKGPGVANFLCGIEDSAQVAAEALNAAYHAGQAQPSPSAGVVEPVGYISADEMDRLKSRHDARVKHPFFGPSALDRDVALYAAPQPPVAGKEQILANLFVIESALTNAKLFANEHKSMGWEMVVDCVDDATRCRKQILALLDQGVTASPVSVEKINAACKEVIDEWVIDVENGVTYNEGALRELRQCLESKLSSLLSQ